MAFHLLLVAIVIIACVFCNKISTRIGTPMLLAFILLGMFFGSDGVMKIHFDDFAFAEQICSIALIFIMFYGGFGTKWSAAKPIAIRAILLSSFGTMLTAGLVGLFAWFVLRIPVLESFLIGAVISSTDAASVFSILRSHRLNLRDHTASLLELESGSNDPFSYMLTIIILSMMMQQPSVSDFVVLLFVQLFAGIFFGVVIAGFTYVFLKRNRISSSGFRSIFLLATAMLAYALPTLIDGNGYLSVYIFGMIIGNCRLENKQELVHFFDGITGLMQMLLFFILGLLAFPSQLPSVALSAFIIALFLTFIARPLVVFSILSFFKSPIRQRLLVAWSGMRGAASIVFAIMTVIHPASFDHDIFHIVFFIVLFSILIQGSLLPLVAKKLKMIDPNADVLKTFSDYEEEESIQFIQFILPKDHPWVNTAIRDILWPPDTLLVMIIRDHKKILPNGKTILSPDDRLILGGQSLEHENITELKAGHLFEEIKTMQPEWIGKRISEITFHYDLIVLIKRDGKMIIPKGHTILEANDILVVCDKRHMK